MNNDNINANPATREALSEQSGLDATTTKYSERFDKFSKSKSGNVIVDFVSFKTNLVPYTLVILYIGGVCLAWLSGLGAIVNVGPLATPGTELGDRIVTILKGLALIVAAPFVIHYLLELVKYIFQKVLVPLWNKIVIHFLVNVLPELLPFMFERFMKFIDLALDGMVAGTMAVAAVLKGVVWLPKTLCQRLGRWARKPLGGEDVK